MEWGTSGAPVSSKKKKEVFWEYQSPCTYENFVYAFSSANRVRNGLEAHTASASVLMVGALASRAAREAAYGPSLDLWGEAAGTVPWAYLQVPNYPWAQDIFVPSLPSGGHSWDPGLPGSSCRSGEPPGFRMVNWGLEGFTLLTLEAHSAGGEPEICSVFQGICTGGRGQGQSVKGCTQHSGAGWWGWRATEEGLASRAL